MFYVYFTHFITIIMTDSEVIARKKCTQSEDSCKELVVKDLGHGGEAATSQPFDYKRFRPAFLRCKAFLKEPCAVTVDLGIQLFAVV